VQSRRESKLLAKDGVNVEFAIVAGFSDLSAEETGSSTVTNVKQNVRVSPLGATPDTQGDGDIIVDSGDEAIFNVQQISERSHTHI